MVQLFRPFSEALDEFLKEHGYSRDINNIEAKITCIRTVFTKANMDVPREVREWFLGQPVKRDTVTQENEIRMAFDIVLSSPSFNPMFLKIA